MPALQNREDVEGSTEHDDVRIVVAETKDPEPNDVAPFLHRVQGLVCGLRAEPVHQHHGCM